MVLRFGLGLVVMAALMYPCQAAATDDFYGALPPAWSSGRGHGIDPEFLFAALVAVSLEDDVGVGGSFRLSVPIVPGPTAPARGAIETGASFIRDEQHAIWAAVVPVTGALRGQMRRLEIAARGGAALTYVGSERLYAREEWGVRPTFGASASFWLPTAQFAVALGVDVHLLSSPVGVLQGGIAF